MALNFGILQPVNIGGQILAGQQEAQRNQLAQQQMAASQQQMQTGAMQQEKAQLELAGFKRRQAGLDQFLIESAKRKKTGSPEQQADSFYDYSLTQEDPQLILAAQTIQQAARERSAYNASRQPPKISPVGPAFGAMGSGSFDMPLRSEPMVSQSSMANQISPATTMPVRPTTPAASMTAAPMVNQLAPPPAAAAAPVNQLGVDTRALENRINDLRTNYPNVPQAQKEADRLEKRLDELGKTAPDAMLMQQLGYPLTQAGYQAFRDAQRQERMLSPAEEQQKVRIAAASRPPAQPRAEQPPVAVVGPDGKQIYVTREEALSKRMTPANAMEGLAPKEIQAREAKFPAATSAVKTFESSADRLAKDLETLATHKGLSGISGLIYGRTPAVTKEARAAKALYDSILARGGFQELQNMRASSPTGGALGSVSNQEGEYLRAAFAPLNLTQDTADLSRVLTEAASAAKVAKQRVREAYDMTYDYKNQGGGGKVVDFGSLK